MRSLTIALDVNPRQKRKIVSQTFANTTCDFQKQNKKIFDIHFRKIIKVALDGRAHICAESQTDSAGLDLRILGLG